MAKANKTVNKISDKLVKVNESFSVNLYDNGFMFEVGGRDSDDEWKTAKILANTEEHLLSLVKEVIAMDRVE